MVVVVLVYQLKVFHGRFVYATIEIQHERLHLCDRIRVSKLLGVLTFVPLGWLVKEEHDPLCVINLKLFLYGLVFLSKQRGLGHTNQVYLHQLTSRQSRHRARLPWEVVLSCDGVPLSQGHWSRTE